MKHAEKTILWVLVLALTCLCFSQVATAKNSDYIVRVGLSISTDETDTSLECVRAECEYGFELGISSEREFARTAEFLTTSLLVCPAVRGDDDGLREAMELLSLELLPLPYRVQHSASFGSYSEAYAKSIELRGFVAEENGAFVIRSGGYATYAEAAEAAKKTNEATVFIPKETTFTVLDGESGEAIFEYDGESVLAIRGIGCEPVTIATENGTYAYDGFFELGIKERRMTVYNCVGLEDYVKGVMISEVGNKASDETTRAFSILIRTVPLRARHSPEGFDVCCSSCCQNYRGYCVRDARLDAIVDSTAGQVITYHGKPIVCPYHGSNGGKSCSSSDAWGGAYIPYLVSITLPEEEGLSSWEITYTVSQLTKMFSGRSRYYPLKGDITYVEVSSFAEDGSGFVTAITLYDEYDNCLTLTKSANIRDAFKLNSANFTVINNISQGVMTADGEKPEAKTVLTSDGLKEVATGGASVLTGDGMISESKLIESITFIGNGKGHGVGFSRTGAEILGEKGFDAAYMVGFYFPGTDISDISDVKKTLQSADSDV